MSIRIINYSDIKNLKNHKEYDFIKNTVHICATADMTKGMYKKYGYDFTKPIISIGDISRAISGTWEDSLEKLVQYTVITKCIKELEADNSLIQSNDESLIKAAKRNKLDILDSIRNLIECNVDIDKFVYKTKDEKVFIDIWRRFEKHYEKSSVEYFNDVFFSDNSYNEIFYNRFKDAIIKSIEIQEKRIDSSSDIVNMLKTNKEKIIYEVPKSLVFHGFYYIKPIHDRLIELVEAIGIEIIFLNWYDHRYYNTESENNDSVFEIWEETFNEDFGYPSKDTWIYDNIYNENRICDVFASIYSDNKVVSFNKSRLIKYNKSIEFINDYKRDEHYYSSESKDMNDILKDYYPDEYTKRHFLSYPIGQFIYLIHNMWDDESEKFNLDMDTLQQMFSSGWLNINNNGQTLNADNYTYDLYKIAPYMKYCITIEEWISRLDTLCENNKNAKSYNIEYMDKFSFFDVDVKRVSDILKFVEYIKKILDDLDVKSKTSINEYFEKLLMLINDIEINSETKIEQNIIINLKELLSKGIGKHVECSTEDIIKALTLVLNGDFESDENDIYDYKNEIVKSIKKIEAAPLLYNEDACIHICKMDESYMKKKINFTWPLNKYSIDRLLEISEDGTKRLLKRMKIVSEKSEAINKYLFYCMLQSSNNIKISWIKNYNSEVLDKALYIKLLQQYFDEDTYENNTKLNEDENYIKKGVDELLDILSKTRQSNKFANIEKDICKNRFYYSYIANNKSVYTSDFHHQHLFTGLIKYEAYKNRYKTNYTFNNIEGMFPQWKDIEKNQLKKYIGEYIPYRDYNYEEQVNILGYNYIATENNKTKCIYCPHIDYCRDAIYSIDIKFR